MRFKHVALGCLAIPVVLILVGALFFLVAWLKGPLPESTDTVHQLEEPLPRSIVPPAGSEAAGGTTAGEVTRGKVLTVRLDLEEGQFEIAPGAFGGSIQVDGDFAEGTYELKPEWSETKEGPRFELTFRGVGVVGQLQKLLHDQGHVDEPRVRIDLPQGVPMHLSIRTRKCEADVDLSGLSLLSLEYEHAMGSSVMLFRDPNPVVMDMMDVRAKMGELEIEGLGYASPREFAFSGRMGDYRLDFDGDWKQSAIASVDMMMGSATVRVPRNVDLDHENRYVLFGGIESPRRSRRRDPEAPEQAKSVTLKTSVRFGDISVR